MTNRGSDRSDRNQPRQKKEEKKPLTLTFTSIMYYRASQQLVVMVQATRGNKPVEGIDVLILVPPNTLGTGKTDKPGRMTITSNVPFPPKVYQLIAETVGGEYTQTTGAFVIPQPYELTDDTPVVYLTLESSEIDGNFVVVANITGRRGSAPIQNEWARIDYDDGSPNKMETAQLDGSGNASKRLTIPVNKRKKIVVNVRVTLPGVTGAPACTKVITLEHIIKRPVQMTYLTRPTGPLTYEISLCVEDADGKPIKDVELVAATDYGTLPKTTDTTNEHGQARFTITLAADHPYTECTVDCPGLLDNAKIRLRGQQPTHKWCNSRGPVIGAGISLLFALVLFLMIPVGVIKSIGSFVDQPAITTVGIPPVDSLRTSAERQVYQYLTFEQPQNAKDSALSGIWKTPTRSSLWSFATYLWLILGTVVCTGVAVIFMLISVFSRAQQLGLRMVDFIRQRRNGVADNNPNLWGRLLNRYLGHDDGKGAAVTATGMKPAMVQTAAVQTKETGSTMSHWLPVILYGVVDFLFERVTRALTRRSDKNNSEKGK